MTFLTMLTIIIFKQNLTIIHFLKLLIFTDIVTLFLKVLSQFQFEKTYPNIYAARFPNPESEASLLPQKVKNKSSLKTLPISRQKGLRF